MDLARFRPHKTLTQHVKAPLAPSPSLAGRDRAFPRSGDVNNCAAETGSTGLCSGLPLPSLLSRDHLAPFLAPPWEGHRSCVGLGLHPGQQELLLGTAAANGSWGPAAPGFLFLEIPQPQATRHPSCRHSPSAGFLALIPFVTEGDYYIYIYIIYPLPRIVGDTQLPLPSTSHVLERTRVMGRQHWLQPFHLYCSPLAELSYCSLLTSTPPSLALAPNHPAQGPAPKSSWAQSSLPWMPLSCWCGPIIYCHPPRRPRTQPALVSQIDIWPPETAVQVLSLGPLSQL